MSLKQPKYSIIVPIYNSEKYIGRCIESVQKQTEQDWELLLINDGSSDNSESICTSFQSQDTRIKYFYQKNSGVSSARNRGLLEAQGEWITFIDSDDWIEENHLETFNKQIAQNVDLCINSFIVDLSYGSRNFNYINCKSFNKADSIKLLFTVLKAHSQFLWIKAFKRSIIKDYNISFNEQVNLGEDNIFILNYISHINSLSSSSIATYHYDQIEENMFSLGRRKRSIEDLLFQIEKNTEAYINLYEQVKIDTVLNVASNYYYSRIFERILVSYKQNKFLGLFYTPPTQLLGYNRYKEILRINSVNNPLINKFWLHIDYDYRNIYFNLYIIKKCLISKIIKIAADVKHALKYALKSVL